MAAEGEGTRQAAWRALLAAHALLARQVDGDLAEAGVLSMDSYDALLALSEAPQRRLRLGELAERALLTRSGVTRLADRLERDGLLRREECPGDRRGSYAVLTDKGEAQLRRTWAVYSKSILAHFGAHLSDAEAEVLQTALSKLIAAARG